jgi:hypothetical protein
LEIANDCTSLEVYWDSKRKACDTMIKSYIMCLFFEFIIMIRIDYAPLQNQDYNWLVQQLLNIPQQESILFLNLPEMAPCFTQEQLHSIFTLGRARIVSYGQLGIKTSHELIQLMSYLRNDVQIELNKDDLITVEQFISVLKGDLPIPDMKYALDQTQKNKLLHHALVELNEAILTLEWGKRSRISEEARNLIKKMSLAKTVKEQESNIYQFERNCSDILGCHNPSLTVLVFKVGSMVAAAVIMALAVICFMSCQPSLGMIMALKSAAIGCYTFPFPEKKDFQWVRFFRTPINSVCKEAKNIPLLEETEVLDAQCQGDFVNGTNAC